MTDAQQALRAMADANGGRLVPDRVVEAARNPENPMHGCFEWNDGAAAAAHRVNQARALIRSIRVEVIHKTFSMPAPAFVRDPGTGRAAGYISVGTLRSDSDLAREAAVAEFSRAAAALRRAKAVSLALGMADEVESLVSGVEQLIVQVQDERPAIQ